MIETPCSLCAPDEEKSCFACCPPIRPPGYEHLQYTNEIKRFLRENTVSLRREQKSISPITGFSCWALGYLDDGFKRTLNPLFQILGWGSPVLNLVALAERERDLRTDSILEIYSFFKTTLSPRANAYPLRALVDSETLELLKIPQFRDRFEVLSHRLSKQMASEVVGTSDAPHVHLLSMDPDFLNFLRLSGGIVKASQEEATLLKKLVDHELEQFRKGFSLF